jgi:hypothetical protein
VKDGFRGVWEVDGKMMGCGGRDLNRSRESWLPEGERLPSSRRTFARRSVCVCGRGTNVRPRAPGEGANDRPVLGERLLHQCLQHY